MEERELVDSKDDILTTKLDPFDFNNPIEDPKQLATDMIGTIRKHKILALSANEIGLNTRVIVLDTDPIFAMFNPVVTTTFGEEIYLEETDITRCDIVCKIKRPSGVRVRFQDINGEFNVEKFVGLTARNLLHHIDNINGQVFYNKATSYHRQQALKNRKKISGQK